MSQLEEEEDSLSDSSGDRHESLLKIIRSPLYEICQMKAQNLFEICLETENEIAEIYATCAMKNQSGIQRMQAFNFRAELAKKEHQGAVYRYFFGFRLRMENQHKDANISALVFSVFRKSDSSLPDRMEAEKEVKIEIAWDLAHVNFLQAMKMLEIDPAVFSREMTKRVSVRDRILPSLNRVMREKMLGRPLSADELEVLCGGTMVEFRDFSSRSLLDKNVWGTISSSLNKINFKTGEAEKIRRLFVEGFVCFANPDDVFPIKDIADQTGVFRLRFPTREETQSNDSYIFIDIIKRNSIVRHSKWKISDGKILENLNDHPELVSIVKLDGSIVQKRNIPGMTALSAYTQRRSSYVPMSYIGDDGYWQKN